MPNIESRSVPFWPEQDIRPYGSELPLLFNMAKNFIDKDWPANGPSQDEVIHQLANAKMCWVSSYKPQDRIFVTFLLGKYKVASSVGESEGKSRFWLNKISFANNQDRARMLENGALISFNGMQLVTGREFGNGLERSSQRFSSGRYVSELLEIIKSAWRADGEEIEVPQEEENSISYEEQEMVEVLRTFIDAEYALEQIAAQQCLPFSATIISARSQKTTYKLHYQITFDKDDYARLLELQPSLLVMLSEMREPTDLLIEISDINPLENEPVIYVSIDKQLADSNIPESGMLGIAAIPTLKKVRNAVVDNLEERSSKNPWLLSLAAGTYQHKALIPVTIPLPESKFPPTESQVKAINSGVGSNDYTLVLGPPGTGKTTVILQWVKYFAAQGKRVLVTSQNNKAVDNVLERLAEEDDFECIRIGNENKISSSLEKITLDNKAAELQEKMFTQGDNALESLRKQYSGLEIILSNRDHVLGMIASRERLQFNKVDALTKITTIKQRLVSITTSQVKIDEQILSIRNSLKTLSGKEWPILNFIRQALNKSSKRRLDKKLKNYSSGLEQLHKEKNNHLCDIEQTEKHILAFDVELSEVNNEIKGYFNSIDNFISEIAIPNYELISVDQFVQLDSTFEKISALMKTLEEWFEKLKKERQQVLYKLLIENVNVVGATCIGINTKALFRELDFDVVIVDESGQIQLHNLIVPLSRANKAILVGDHKQLPPVVSDEVLEEISSQGFDESSYQNLYRYSWFEHLWNGVPADRKIMLDTQFRCPSIISDFVSEAFYEGNYFAGVGMEKKKALFTFCTQPMVWVDTRTMENKAEQSTREDGRRIVLNNRCETALVISILKRSIAELPELAENREIGVIVPYANHVKAIHKAIRKEQKNGRLTELTMPLNELVASVDSFQGQERDLIIFAFSRSNLRGQVGFLADWRRLNVAQTRAKKQLIMIGDSEALCKGAHRIDGHDYEFKKAMVLLKKQCKEKGALLNGGWFEEGAVIAKPKFIKNKKSGRSSTDKETNSEGIQS